jgi:tyrocidine synthetase-3
MLEDSDTFLILTNNKNRTLAENLIKVTPREIGILNLDSISHEDCDLFVKREVSGDSPAYILYTSGSTGWPKGVFQNHENVLYYTRNWIERFSITSSDRMTLFSAFSHDGSVQDMFAALLAGATLYPLNIKQRSNTDELYNLLREEKITIWHSVPSLYRYFVDTLKDMDQFPDIRFVLLGGEPLREHDITLFKKYFPKSTLANIYGQTESSVSAICMISQQDTFDKVTIGEPLDKTELLLVAEDGREVEGLEVGEIVVACDHIAPGYWKDKENTEKVFTHDSEMGRMYWTGDLGRLTADGMIKVMGRKDYQVKIRGFRVETGEIETVLLQHEGVREAVVVARENESSDNDLCAYIVPGETLALDQLRTTLGDQLPDYMVPRYFVILDVMPVTPNGKIDRNQLPEPGRDSKFQLVYEAPRNETERKLTAIWEEVLGVEKIGINNNFIDLGGHSLLVISIISNIHKVFNVELQLKDVFDHPTIKELSCLISESRPTVLLPIKPVEEKEYYNASPDQTRMYILSQYEGIGNTYNLYDVVKVEGKIDKKRFQEIFPELIKRHESLRTSFEMIDGKLIQHIHQDFHFQLLYIEAEKENLKSPASIRKTINNLIRPFDLTKFPLIRIGLIKLAEETHLVLQDFPHIISDGISCNILINEFIQSYQGKKLPGLKLKYKDYSEWQNQMLNSPQVMQQEEYWGKRFKGEIPVLNLPTNYPRPGVQSFEGDIVRFTLNKEITGQLNRLARDRKTTLYIVLLTIYNILLHKYSGQEDIIIGSIIAGRNHVDFKRIFGYFVKTLALRNCPTPDKTFQSFLQEVKENTLRDFENQLYPFDRLLEKLDIKRNPGRNPLFDVIFIMQNTEKALPEGPMTGIDFKVTPYETENKTAMFDLNFEASENGEEIDCCFQYCTKLFERETIELMKERFLILIESILDNRDVEIRDLDWKILLEKEINNVQEVEFDF